ncbi:hypothetical protein ACWATR_34320 [Nostoc sp. UIC 10890]
MSKTRYSKDWKQIPTDVKDASDWRCTKCDRVCLRQEVKNHQSYRNPNAGFTTSKWFDY